MMSDNSQIQISDTRNSIILRSLLLYIAVYCVSIWVVGKPLQIYKDKSLPYISKADLPSFVASGRILIIHNLKYWFLKFLI